MKKEILHKLLSLGVQLKITDGNLKVNAPKGVLTKELLEEIKEHKTYLINLISSNTSIPKTEVKESYALTPTQYFMWFTHEYLGGNKAYNITATLKLKGKLNSTLLENAFRQVIARHESLRTIFRKNEREEIQQYILTKEETEFKLQTVMLQHFSVEQLHNQITQEYQKAFDLEKDLLLSATLLKRNEEEYILLFVLHHIIGDGWSLQILTREVMMVYNSLVSEDEIKLSELSIQYKDYSEWLNEKLISPEYNNKLEYWKQQFETKSPVLDLISGKRPAMKTYKGRVHNYKFSKQFLDELNIFAKEQQMTLFMLLFGGLNGLFSKYTGQTDITLGTTVAGREHADLEHQIGLYSNALPIRTQFDKGESFLHLMQKQKQTLIKAYKNKEYPFTALVNHLSLPKDQSRSALFDIMVLLQNHQGLEINDQKGIDGVVASEYNEIQRGVSQLDISFVFVEKEEGLSLSVEYNTDIYEESFIINLLHHFEVFVKAGLQKPDRTLNSIEIVTPPEKNKLLNEFNQALTPYEPSLTVVSLIKSIAKGNPNQTALIHRGEKISYAFLEEYSNKLANYLELHFNICKGDFIGIELERNSWTIITIMAVLKTGAVYVPIDLTYPKARKNYIQQDSGCKLIVSSEVLEIFVNQANNYSGEYISTTTQKDLAYVIYTSGSTGNPKGVQITQEAFVDYVITFKNYFHLTSQDSVVQQASISFDTSIEEIFPILISGGVLVFHEEKSDFKSLFSLCERYKITILSTNPYALQSLNQVYDQYDLKIRILISGGDILQPDYINNLWDKVSIYNTYGPTESTVCATYYKITNKETTIPIGKPIPNRQVYIVEPDSTQLAPVGIVGELCISGNGLSGGYINQPELTKDRFVQNPFNPDTLMYRTGDLGRWLPDGNIEFIGRKDHQVKIRGFRIELGEIENTISQYSTDLKQAVVVTKEVKGEKVLVGYYVSETEIDKAALRTYLQGKLPDYMIPNFYMELEKLPLTSNGKIDRKSLPSVNGEDLIRNEYVAPSNDIENKLVSIWQEVLGIEKTGITDNFFELGGHSLIMAQVINRTHKQLGRTVSFKTFFANPTIEGLSKELQENEYMPIPKATETDSYPLTASQTRLWILSQLEGGSLAYNMPAAVKLIGAVDVDKFEESLRLLIHRHEILRTCIKTNEEGDIRQYIISAEHVNFKITKEDYSSVENQEETITSYLQEKNNEPFDLEQAPLVRAYLIKLKEEEYVFFLSLHHIIGDGWSIELLISEIVKIYNSLTQGKEINLPELSIQYKDYAIWLNKTIQQEKHQASEQYWLEQFEGELPVLDLPSFKIRPLIQTYNGASITHQFSKAFLEKLKDFSKAQDVTLFMTLMAGVNALLHRYSGQDDIIIGTPIAGREHPDLENQLGLYLNTLAIRTQFKEGSNFLDLVAAQKEILLGAYEHQSYPFDALVNKLNLKRDPSRSALFDVLVVLQNQGQLNNLNNEELISLKVEEYILENKISKFDLGFTFIETEGLNLTIQYNTDIYDMYLIKRMFTHFENILTQFVEYSEILIQDVDYITEAEKQQILLEFNDARVDYPKNKTIIDLFEDQVEQTPNNIAVVFEDVILTYQELNERANQLAFYLNKQGVKPGSNIILCFDSHLGMAIVGIIGILKAGAVYVPIDPNYPQDRINYIIENIGAKFIISNSVDAPLSNDKDVKVILLDKNEFNYNLETIKNIEKDITNQNNAYVIYTSGSTGIPKGVLVNHQSIMDYLFGLSAKIKIEENQSFALMSTVSTDLGNTVLFSSLIFGKTIHLFSKNSLRDISFIQQYFRDNNIDCIKIVPPYWKFLNESDGMPTPNRMIIFGGEELTNEIVDSVEKKDPNVVIINHYGPTETTVGKLLYVINDNQKGKAIPIGKAFSNTQLYVLDKNGMICPIGVSGELHIGGDGVSEGYLNNSTLTEEKFIKNHIDKHQGKLYKTGDLVVMLPDGNIEFKGRIDNQVKILGHRIELNEIERSINEFPSIKTSVVQVKQTIDGNKKLIAYIISSDEFKYNEIRKYLEFHLPDYMIPSFYVKLDALPLTTNGKIDRKALPDVDESELIKSDFVAAKTGLEKSLVVIWQEVLGVEKIGITDNFFELGGHSLIVAQVINRAHKQFGKTVSFKVFFTNPTIEGLSKELQDNKYISITKAPESGSYPLTASQGRLWVLSQLEGGSLAYNMPAAVRLRGIIDINKFEESFRLLIHRHEILRTYFKINTGGEIRQYVVPGETFNFTIREEDYSSEINQEEAVTNYLQEKNNEPFDLGRGPLVRATIIKLKEDDYVFFLSLHHIIGDGWSVELLISEVVKIYNALTQGKEIDLPELSIQYKDYAVWLIEEIQKEKHQISEGYWLQQFKGELPVLDLPSFKPRPLVQTYKGDNIRYQFSKEFLEKLKNFSKKQDVTLFMTLMAGVNALLHRYSGQDDIIIGTPIAGREHPDLENQLGLYLNTLAIRTQIKEGISFLDLVSSQREILLEAYEHQGYPFDGLIDKLNLKRDLSRSVLFDVLVVLQNQGQLNNLNREELNNLEVSDYDFQNRTSKFDISFIFVETEGLSLVIEYNTDIYDRYLIERMFIHFENLILQSLEQPTIQIQDIDYLTETEKLQLLVEFNDTRVDYPKDKTVIDLFENQVEQTPNNIAVVFEDIILTYRELNERANQLAFYLRETYLVQANDLIGIKLGRSEQMIIVLLGILKSGAAYVPIDPSYPNERIVYIEKDSDSKVVIDEEELKRFTEVQDKYSKSNIEKINQTDDLMYVIYTSGTTGNPKGVMVANRSVINFLYGMSKLISLKEKEHLLAITSISFDISILELFWTLINGIIISLKKDNTSLNNFDLFLEENLNIAPITSMQITPSYLEALLEDNNSSLFIKSLKSIIVGGEKFSNELLDKLKTQTKSIIYNMYGPTETTIWSTFQQVKDEFALNIGKPILNTQIYILDDHQRICPIGVKGELCIGGEGLSRGYYKDEKLTKDKFVNFESPANQDARIYKTGDLARWLPDATLEYLGRLDNQVKINGFRIELGEIESTLLKHEGINQVVVIAAQTEKDNNNLIAYFISNKKLEASELRKYIAKKLPYYMVPNHFIKLEELPLTPNGKLNRKALPSVSGEDLIRKEYVAPRNETEEQLVVVWQEILDIDKIGITDNFFELGGHSLNIMKLLHIIDKQFSVKLTIAEFFDNPKVESISFLINELRLSSNNKNRKSKKII